MRTFDSDHHLTLERTSSLVVPILRRKRSLGTEILRPLGISLCRLDQYSGGLWRHFTLLETVSRSVFALGSLTTMSEGANFRRGRRFCR